MADIVDTEEQDRDTIEPDELEQLFSKQYKLLTEQAVSLKTSYVNKLCGTDSLQLAVSQSDNSIEIYQFNKSSLSRVCRLSGHKKTVTEVVFSPTEGHYLYTSGLDGVLKLWDTRASGTCAQEYHIDDGPGSLKPFESMDVSCNGLVLCAGSQLVKDDAYLVYWDQRKPTPLGGYWNSHTDDITQVKFHKTNCASLVTGSADGLLNVFNILEAKEDDALTYSLNVENSVEKLSWLDERTVSCVTQSNDLQLWNIETGDLVRNYNRDKIARSIKRSKGDDCYVVDAFSTDDGPAVVAGSYVGNGECLRSVMLTGKKLLPSCNFKQNRQVVRCCWHYQDRDILVTAGEAGLVSVWAPGESKAERRPIATRLKDKKLRGNRHKPY